MNNILKSLFILCSLTLGLMVFAPTAIAQENPKEAAIDWVGVESTGSLSSAKEGALEKNLWKDQRRSDIEFLISKLPTQIELRSVLNLQRKLLLSGVDSSLITNDIGPLRGNDLLIQRIKKLMDMGLYDDAWSLYVQKSENPYDSSIAQLGMLLLIIKNDLPTACLEEKVLSTQYPDDSFFKLLDKACSKTLGATANPQFPQSAVLQSIYNTPTYKVSASSFESLTKMNYLERALTMANGKISYDGLNKDLLAKTPSAVIALYVMDKTMPESARLMVEAEMNDRGLSWHTPLLAKAPLLKRAKELSKDLESQWPVLESALAEIKNPADLAPFVDMIAKNEPKNISTENIIKVLGAFLAHNQNLPEFWIKAATKAAPQKPIIYIYLQAFSSLTPTKGIEIDQQKLAQSLKNLKLADSDQIIAIIRTIDKEFKIHNNPSEVYEKHLVLTVNNNYVMPIDELNFMLDTAAQKKEIGITVLAILNSLAAKPDQIYSGTASKMLDSMLNVGLIEDAKLIGGESIASVLNKY